MKKLLKYLLEGLLKNLHDRVMPSNRSFSRLDLSCPEITTVSGQFNIPSQNSVGVFYHVSLENQTCSCPNFQNRRNHPKDSFPRWCKHLVTALYHAGAFSDCEVWHKAIAEAGHGGPLGAFFVETDSSQRFLLTAGRNPDWINVLGRTLRKGERSDQATGRIREFGWCISEQRWSYGQGPPGARQLRKLMEQIDKIEHF
ncbi:SWIM zinc finger family protein [Rhodobacteraceae bacterium R_SAG8]|nr:SWIM zinc finger family protein [Rhodobacteraceae bacterium R_SAG8]